MAVAIDLVEWNGIYPGRKKRKGNGLALSAMKAAYHEKDIVHSGPLYHTYDVKMDTVYIHFIHTGSGLTTHDGEPLRTFSIADRRKNMYGPMPALKVTRYPYEVSRSTGLYMYLMPGQSTQTILIYITGKACRLLPSQQMIENEKNNLPDHFFPGIHNASCPAARYLE